MKPALLVTGSLAFDRIAVFQDQFANHILKGHVHNLNVAFTVEDMAIYHGGTGGNIAYNLALLGNTPYLVAAAGHDARDYLDSLEKKRINLKYVKKWPKKLTANATIMTDLDDNQITSFYMGAMANAHQIKMSTIKEPVSIAIIAPNDPKAMLAYADHCFEKEIPFIADPGQIIPVFSKKELTEFITGASMLVVNDYELSLIQDKTGLDLPEILSNVGHLIVTYGDQGSKIWGEGATVIDIPAYKADKVEDPTGCGDAYRAGLMHGYHQGLSIEKSANIGAWLAARCVEKKGTQNHKVTKTDFQKFLKKLK